MPLSEPTHASPIDDAELHLARGDRRAAVACLEQAAADDPFDDEVRILAAGIHYQDGARARASELAMEAVEIRPFHPSALNLIAACCLEGGYPELGREILQWIHRAVPGFERARRNLKQSRGAARRERDVGASVSGLPPRGIRRVLDGREPRLSACVACRDEGVDLGPLVDSLVGLAAEVIVVDAGGGRAIETQAFPVTVHHVDWIDDASALRNEAIRRATGDWILLLEQHERVLPSSIPRVEAAMRGAGCLSMTVEIHDGNGVASHLEPRLFRNAPGVSLAGRVYPRIDPALATLERKWKLGERPSGVVVTSSRIRAYAADRGCDRARLESLTREDLRRNPEHLYLALQRARVAAEIGETQHALDVLDKIRQATEDRGTQVEREEHATLEARCLIARSRPREADDRIREYHRDAPPTANTLFLEASAARALGNLDEAVALIRRSNRVVELSRLPRHAEAIGAQLASVLGATLLDLGRLEEAEGVFLEAIDRDPSSVTARMGLLGTRLARGHVREMLEGLDLWVAEGGSDPGVWTFGGLLLGKVPALTEVAREWLDEACRRFPDHTDLRMQRIESVLRCGDAEQALADLGTRPCLTPAEVAVHFAASLAAGVELPPVPSEARASVEDAVMGWLKTWRDRSAWSTLDQALVEIHRAESELPGLRTRAADWLDEIGQVDAASRTRRGEPMLEPAP